MLARTAFGECGSAHAGPSATHDAPKASALRSTVPTLPGSPTPCRYTHSGPCGSLQRCSYTPIARVPEPSVETLASVPFNSSHFNMTPQQRLDAGIPPGLLRLSVGLEGADELVADLRQAIAATG